VEQLVSEDPSRRFDAVVASEVLEHVDNPQFFVDTCSALLNPGKHPHQRPVI
jgi:polyprenyldihydroxybenzoate methyltransferase/3-demethylubiquinol 3-O-methyltransferase